MKFLSTIVPWQVNLTEDLAEAKTELYLYLNAGHLIKFSILTRLYVRYNWSVVANIKSVDNQLMHSWWAEKCLGMSNWMIQIQMCWYLILIIGDKYWLTQTWGGILVFYISCCKPDLSCYRWRQIHCQRLQACRWSQNGHRYNFL